MAEVFEVSPQKPEYEFDDGVESSSSSSLEDDIPLVVESEESSSEESEELEDPKGSTNFISISILLVICTIGATLYCAPILYTNNTEIMYPLLLEQHDTYSRHYKHDLAIKHRIVSQLKLHLIANPQYTLLCMHHLRVPIPYIKICVLYAHDQFITMLNPRLIGGSTEKSIYNEKSVACTNTSTNERQKSAMVQWESGTETMYALFDEMESVMLQMIIDEQNGVIKC